MTLAEATSRLRELEREAVVAVRMLAAGGSDHLLAEIELDVPAGESECIDALRTYIGELGAAEAMRTLWRAYPATCALYTADVGRREYDHGALYPAIGLELGLSHMQVIHWGDKFLEFLDTIQLERFWSGDLTRYRLESILLHGGLPDDAWTQIWQSLILPAVEAGDTSDDAARVVEHALAKSWAAPQLRKTTQHIIDNGGSLILRLITNALDAAQFVKENGYLDDQVDYRLPPGALASLQQLLEAPRLKWPELRFDESRANPIYLHCPEQAIPRTPFRNGLRVDYWVYQVGANLEELQHDEVPAYVRSHFMHIDATSLTLSSTSGFDAVVRLSGLDRSGHPREKRIQWRETAISSVWVFSRYRQHWVAASSGQRQAPYTDAIYVAPSDYSVSASGSARVTQATPLSGGWSGWTAHWVTAPEGGSVEFTDAASNRIGGVPLGQKCAIAVLGEDTLPIGSLIMGEPAPRVYGRRLPTIGVTPLDMSEPIDRDVWSCSVEWTDCGRRRKEAVPFVADGPYCLRADLNELDEALGPIVGDGLLRVEGPHTWGSLARPFARAPITAPQPIEIEATSLGEARVIYRLESETKLASDVWRGEDVRMLEPSNDGAYRFSAPLSKNRASLTVRMNGQLLPMNLTLLGVSLTTQEVNPAVLKNSAVPAALLAQYPHGFLRIHCEAGSNALVSLTSCDTDEKERAIRTVGRDGRHTETVALAEIHALAQDRAPLAVGLVVEAGRIRYRQPVMTIVPGVGLGACKIEDDGDGVSVTSSAEALVRVEVTVRDLTRPWRPAASGVIEIDDTRARLQPRPFDMYAGRYGLWLSIEDEWGTSGQRCSAPPDSITIVTPEDSADASPAMGAYMGSLTALLLHTHGLAPRAKSVRRTSMPSLGMLEVDAEASVWAALRAQDDHVSREENSANAARLGAEIMDLKDYRYALCPTVLRALLDSSFVCCTDSASLIACMCILRLPLLPIRRANSGEFAAEELDAAWRLNPLLGTLAAQMHAQIADGTYARQSAAAWLLGVGVETLAPDCMLEQLHVCHHSVASASARDPIQPVTRLSRTSSTRAFGAWIDGETTAAVRDVSVWLRDHIRQARTAVDYMDSHSRGFKQIAAAIRQRDPGDYTLRVDQLPFVIGATALVATAQAYSDSAAPRAANIMGGDHAADVSSIGLTEVLSDLCAIAPQAISHDLALIRLTAEALQMGDVV